jgi:hypothetical protein
LGAAVRMKSAGGGVGLSCPLRITRVTITRGSLAQERRARLLTPAERAQCWPRLIEAYQPYATMQAGTDRELPFVRLSRAGGASSRDNG